MTTKSSSINDAENKLQELDKRVGKLKIQYFNKLKILNDINYIPSVELTSRVDEAKGILETAYNLILKIQAEQKKARNILEKGYKQKIIEQEKDIEMTVIYYLREIKMHFNFVNKKIRRIKEFIKDEIAFHNQTSRSSLMTSSRNASSPNNCVVS